VSDANNTSIIYCGGNWITRGEPTGMSHDTGQSLSILLKCCLCLFSEKLQILIILVFGWHERCELESHSGEVYSIQYHSGEVYSIQYHSGEVYSIQYHSGEVYSIQYHSGEVYSIQYHSGEMYSIQYHSVEVYSIQYHSGEVYSIQYHSGEVYSIQHYVVKFVSDLRQVCGFFMGGIPVFSTKKN
jgi:hypothetical protein